MAFVLGSQELSGLQTHLQSGVDDLAGGSEVLQQVGVEWSGWRGEWAEEDSLADLEVDVVEEGVFGAHGQLADLVGDELVGGFVLGL